MEGKKERKKRASKKDLSLIDTTITDKVENVTKIDFSSCNNFNSNSLGNLAPKQEQYIPFKDHIDHYTVTRIDKNGVIRNASFYCFWCRHPITDVAIECPIRYEENKIVHKNKSHITNEIYLVQQNIPKNIGFEINDVNAKIIEKSCYITDGSFCSFNCCQAFIEDKYYDPLYRDSAHLLARMYFEMYKTKMNIVSAPSWRLLQNYGGYMTIDEFRESFLKFEYNDQHHYVHEIPKTHPIGFIYEKKYII